ncbi:MAG: hypothetical protein OIF51_13455 [Cellvibrionaceae bacterium]|nr:hypothetical protein [Cellvibrionaceae bacterium]
MSSIESLLMFAVFLGCFLIGFYLLYLFWEAIRQHFNDDPLGNDLASMGMLALLAFPLFYIGYESLLIATGNDYNSKTTLYEVVLEKEELEYTTSWNTVINIEHPGSTLIINAWPQKPLFGIVTHAVSYTIELKDEDGNKLLESERIHSLEKESTIERDGSRTSKRVWKDLPNIEIKAPSKGKLILRLKNFSKPIVPLHVRVEDPLKEDGTRYSQN